MSNTNTAPSSLYERGFEEAMKGMVFTSELPEYLSGYREGLALLIEHAKDDLMWFDQRFPSIKE